MKVDLFSIGKFTVHSYGLLIAIGVVVALLLSMRRAKNKGLIEDEVFNMAILSVVVGFAGGKLLFCLENISAFMTDPMSVLGSSGFVVYGGLVCGIIFAIIYCKIKKLVFLKYFDIIMPGVSIAQGFGRLGCFMAGCCFGKPTDAWWGVVFPEGCFAPAGIALVPTQLMSTIGDWIIAAILIYSSSKFKKDGNTGFFYLILYGIGRFIVECFRENLQGGILGLTTAQDFSVAFIIIGIVLMLINSRKKEAKQEVENTTAE